MKKITFIGLEGEKERFIDRLQAVGITHLILGNEPAEPAELQRELQRVTDARKFLAPRNKKGAAVPAGIHYSEICRRRDELFQQEQRLQTELSALKKERSVTLPWGGFSVEDLLLLRSRGLSVQFFQMARKAFEALDLGSAYACITRETPGEIFFVVFSREPVDLGFPEEKPPARSLHEIEEEIATREKELSALQAEYAQLACDTPSLLHAEAELMDGIEYRRALLNSDSKLENRLFVLRCWSPVSKEELLKRIGPGFGLACYQEEPQEMDRVPVMMTNPSFFEPGEDLVKVYTHPNYGDFDPSGPVLYCFTIFFGMIIGDAGYGLALLFLTLFLKRRFGGQSLQLDRVLKLSFMLSISVIFFGLISASYFGIALDKENPLNRILLLDFGSKEGLNHVMMVSIIMGMVHISISLAIKIYRTRDLPSLGWIIVIWSGYFLADAQMIKGEDAPVALWVMVAGLSLVLLFTSSSKNVIIRLASGFNGVLGIIQLFSDVLSYLRLFALGLATVYMSQTFNMLSEMVYDIYPILTGVIAALVFVGGHAINLLLGVMGGVVHGLRLNFLEWYRWSFEGDGLPFRPFRKIAAGK